MNFKFDIESLKAELAANTRLRLGVWFIGLLVLTWVSLVWSDFNLAQYKTVRQQAIEIAALSDMEPAEIWSGRVSQARARVDALEVSLMQADTDGLAQARFQSELARLMVLDAQSRQTIKVGSLQPMEELEDVSRVRARVAANLTARQLLQSIEQLESATSLMEIERLTVKKSGTRWNLELFVAAYFKSSTGS